MDFVDVFENKLAKYTGFKYAIAVDCCTNGILLACEMQRRLGKISKSKPLFITKWTYMSVPMTLFNNGWMLKFIDDRWHKYYQIGDNTSIFDAATDLHQNMCEDYIQHNDCLVCISFQQKKRLSLGRGGAILTNNQNYYDILKRLRYDGRNAYISDSDEINSNPTDIILGYHCYMEPDKAAKGILIINQHNTMLKPYVEHAWNEYSDMTKLEHIWM